MRSTLPYMPKFRPEERELLKKNKPDAFGLNHYGTSFVAYDEGNLALEQWDQWACAACGLPCIPHSKRYIFTVPDDVPHTFLCPRQIYHHTWQFGAGRIQLALQGSMGLPQTPQLGLEPCNKSKQFQLHQWLQMGKSYYLYQKIKMIRCIPNLEPSCFCV